MKATGLPASSTLPRAGQAVILFHLWTRQPSGKVWKLELVCSDTRVRDQRAKSLQNDGKIVHVARSRMVLPKIPLIEV